MEKEDFDRDMSNGQLVISAEHKEEKEEGRSFTRREFNYTTFSRAFTLPDTNDTDKINAKYENGVLRLNLPKKEESKEQGKKRIAIE